MQASDVRNIRRMQDLISGVRTGRTKLVEAADSLLFLRDAMETLDRGWSDQFTFHIATLESASTVTVEQRRTMGTQHQKLIESTLDDMEKMIASLAAGDVDNG